MRWIARSQKARLDGRRVFGLYSVARMKAAVAEW